MVTLKKRSYQVQDVFFCGIPVQQDMLIAQNTIARWDIL
jgi:hypothetical protein